MGYPPQGPYQQPYGPPPQRPGGSSTNTGLIIGLVLGGVVLLGGIGFVAFLMLRPSPPSPAAQEPPELELDIPDEGVEVEESGGVIPADFGGAWEGHMWQFDSDLDDHDDWDLEVVLAAGGDSATAELWDGSTHLCSWDLSVSYATENELEFDASARDQEVACATADYLNLELTDNGDVDASWEGAFSSGELTTATGTLSQ